MSPKRVTTVKKHKRKRPKNPGKTTVVKHQRLLVPKPEIMRTRGKGKYDRSWSIPEEGGRVYWTGNMHFMIEDPIVMPRIRDDEGSQIRVYGYFNDEPENEEHPIYIGVLSGDEKKVNKNLDREAQTLEEYRYRHTFKTKKPKRFTIYHVTYSENADKIMKEGWIPLKEGPSGQPFPSQIPGAYGFSTKTLAMESVDDSVDMIGDEITRKDFAIIKLSVPVNEKWEPRLFPDEDWSPYRPDWIHYKEFGAGVIEGYTPPKHMERLL